MSSATVKRKSQNGCKIMTPEAIEQCGYEFGVAKRRDDILMMSWHRSWFERQLEHTEDKSAALAAFDRGVKRANQNRYTPREEQQVDHRFSEE